MYHEMIQYIRIWLYMYHNGDILLMANLTVYMRIGTLTAASMARQGLRAQPVEL